MSKKLKSSVWSRSLQMATLVGKVARHEVTQQIRDKITQKISQTAETWTPDQIRTRVDQAKILAENLGRLKGAAMKAGQLLSLDGEDFLPPEALEILSQLQAQATPFAQTEIVKILKAEWGEDKFKTVAELSEKPIASASIGQVHSARLRKQEIAVKVQYPGINKTVESDLAALKKVVQVFLTFSGKSLDLDGVFAELSWVLKRETDYSIELENLIQYSKHLQTLNGFVCPCPVTDYCTQQVLTMTWLKATPILEWMKSASPEEKQIQAEKVLNLYCEEFFKWGLVQTDPNFANFGVTTNGDLAIYDFGAVLPYSADFRKSYVELLRTIGSGRQEEILAIAEAQSLIDPRETDEAKSAFVDLLRDSVSPFNPELQPFHFADSAYSVRLRDSSIRLSRALKYSPPPRHLIFLHRRLSGMFKLLKRMEVTVNLTPYWQKMVLG